MNMINRRRLLIAGALGMGSLPLRSLITGLPIPFLLGASPRALAASTANFLILSHLSSGDPLNANVPGTYPQDPAITTDPLRFIQHATVAELGAIAEGYQNPSTFNLGTASVKAASSWASLPVDLRQHLAFWHHGTYVNAHGELPTVRRLGGAVKGYDGSGTDELGSLVAEELNADLGTVGKEILAVGGNGVVSQGRNVAVLPPTSLKGIFVSSEVNLDKMIAMRDRFIDKAYSDLKVTGTPAQRKFFDQYAISRQSAGTMGNALGDLLSSVTSDAPIDQAKVAVAFLQLGIAPVISLGLPFGGDNHSDSDLLDEVTETNESVAVIAALWGYLKAAGLQDRVQFELCDYRNAAARFGATFDGIASIEMFEAVGEKYWSKFFDTVKRTLKPKARAAIQVITIEESRFEQYRATSDFIQQYIFPGGMLPSPERFAESANKSGLQVNHPMQFGRDYAETLRRWLAQFDGEHPAITSLGYSGKFAKLWRFYLVYCIAGFEAESINVGHYTLSHA